MKKIIIAAGLLVGFILLQPATAQVRVMANIGSQPVWGPVGYDYVEYYYMPDIDVYYYVPAQEYIYLANGRWVYSPILPRYLANYDFYRSYKVVINEPRPYLRHNHYRLRYAEYRGYRNQPIIRDSRDSRYFGIPNHPYYNRNVYANRNPYQSHGHYQQPPEQSRERDSYRSSNSYRDNNSYQDQNRYQDQNERENDYRRPNKNSIQEQYSRDNNQNRSTYQPQESSRNPSNQPPNRGIRGRN